MERDFVKRYFDENALSWVLDGYHDDGYNYPVGLHRVRLLVRLLEKHGKTGMRLADLGCGGGNLALALSSRGYHVVGVDQAEGMIKIAKETLAKAPADIQKRAGFVCRPLQETGLEDGSFDAITSMGVIGYLDTDEELFRVAHRLLKPGGTFILSCRNRLFNMASISFRTVAEIKSGAALELIEEINGLNRSVPAQAAEDMLASLRACLAEMPAGFALQERPSESPSEKHRTPTAPPIEARQHTPAKLTETAARCGFSFLSNHGIHPHLINPRLNALLPPKIFNKLSGCLEPLEDLPISLTWSSVFLGVFQKT